VLMRVCIVLMCVCIVLMRVRIVLMCVRIVLMCVRRYGGVDALRKDEEPVDIKLW
jgi:hypothetical protein